AARGRIGRSREPARRPRALPRSRHRRRVTFAEMAAPFSLFASSAPGIEPLLCEERRALGALEPQVIAGGVRFGGHRRAIYRANLESGLAAHVLVRVGAVVATELGMLEPALGELPWERFLSPGVPRAFRVTAHKSR